MNTQEAVSIKLKKLIKQHFKTQKEFAEAVGINKDSLVKWFNKGIMPSLTLLDKIAQHFNIHISYFFTNDSAANIIDAELFNQVFKLAYKFAEENNITINGSYFLGCYDLVIANINKNKVDCETAFNVVKPIILNFMR